MVILITGAAGFVGNYLIQELRNTFGGKHEIYGLEKVEFSDHTLEWLNGSVLVDIIEYDALREQLLNLKPDVIFHLAAQSSVAASLRDPVTTFRVNQMGTLNLLEIAVKDLNKRPLIILTGSADIYMSTSGEKPMTEETPFNPLNPYAVSKASADYLGKIYWKNFGIKTIRTRSFNHIGPGQSTAFAIPNFARQIARIEKRLQEPVIMVGNLDARRDFTDVRDVVRAYRLLMEKGAHGDVYNVCSNRAFSINEMLRMLQEMAECKFELRQDPDRMRPSENPLLIGDNRKLMTETGWQPEIPIEKTVEDLLNYWRKNFEKE